jgi:hypothetical protein
MLRYLEVRDREEKDKEVGTSPFMPPSSKNPARRFYLDSTSLIILWLVL